MNKIIFYYLIMALIICGCHNDDNYSEFNGTYTEITPVENRTLIKFTSSTDLIIIKPENSADNFKYEIKGNSIILTHASQNQSQSFEFEKISNIEFRIENLYPGIPENGISYMTFKK